MGEAPRYSYSVRYTPLTIKGVSLPRSEISSPDGSISSDSPPSSEIHSFLSASCGSLDVMEGYLDGAILKPGVGTVFFSCL